MVNSDSQFNIRMEELDKEIAALREVVELTGSRLSDFLEPDNRPVAPHGKLEVSDPGDSGWAPVSYRISDQKDRVASARSALQAILDRLAF